MIQTLGEKRVGYKNNEPEEIEITKRSISEIIDHLESLRGDKNTNPASGNKQRLISLAQTKLEEACMFAVKAIYAE